MTPRIVIDARFYGLEHAGIGRYVVELVENLAAISKGFEFHLLVHRKHFNKLKLPANWNTVVADIPHYSLSEQFKLPKYIKSISPDLVHYPHFNVPLFAKFKSVVTIHDMLWHKQKGLSVTNLPLPTYLIKYLGYKAVFSNAVNSSCKIIVPSNTVKFDILKYYDLPQSKIEVIYEGVRVSDKKGVGRSSKKGSEKYFVYVGSTYPHKNVQVIVDALCILNGKLRENYKLKIASSRSVFKDSLTRYIHSRSAQDFVDMLGFVPDNELTEVYRNSVGFIFPSLSEGFGLPGLEAMANGAIVVASDIPVFREVYKSHALYFNPRDANDLVEAMEKVINMTEEKKTVLKRQASRYTHSYSWQETARRTLKVYEDCIGLRSNK